MKTAGIIAEYNPLHHGHRYQIEEVRARTGADYVIVAMSGDFVQRGEPAIYDKYIRTHMALSAGANLVLELPSVFATSSAEDFAACGVALLDRIGVVDLLCFGSECGEVASLEAIARLLIQEPEGYTDRLKERLRSGDPFPLAREYAVRESLHLPESLLSSPNNILGIEYMKALLRRGSRIQPYTIQRCGKGYHDPDLDAECAARDAAAPADPDFASASAIRKAMYEGTPGKAMAHMPITPDANACPLFPDDVSSLLNYRLLELSHTGQNLAAFADVSPDLADRLQHQLLQFASYRERIQLLKTRQYTYTRISRALLHILLGITDAQVQKGRDSDYVSYARILGFNQAAAPLLTQLKEKSTIPLITKTADAATILSGDALAMFQQDLYCSHLYQAILQEKSGILFPNEYTRSLVIR